MSHDTSKIAVRTCQVRHQMLQTVACGLQWFDGQYCRYENYVELDWPVRGVAESVWLKHAVVVAQPEIVMITDNSGL
jgi:hypothetical protein